MVGNGPSAATGGQGQRIDSDEFDSVVRFNEATTQGFEEHLGSRTDVLVITKNARPRLRAATVCLACPRPGATDPRCSESIPRRAWSAAGKDVYGGASGKGRWVSSGLAYIYWRLQEGDEVVVHGFDCMQGSTHHYFSSSATSSVHSPDEELRVMSEFLAQGRITRLAGPEAGWYRRVYDAVYEAGYHSDPEFTHALPIVRWFSNRFRGLRVLDIGASKGAAVRLLTRAGFRAQGVDVSTVACKEARRLGTPVTSGSATNLPFCDDAFDLALHTDVFEHLRPEDVRRAVRESIRVTRFIVGCKICTRVDRDRTHLRRAGIASLADRYHLTVQPLEWWKEMYRREGCTVIDTTTADTFFAVLPGIQIGSFHPPAGEVHRDAERIADLLADRLAPTSVLDLGCNTGHFLRRFRERGIADVLGVDWLNMSRHLHIPAECFHPHDLRSPLDLGRTFDLVLCLEVAEHLPPESADTLIDSIASHASRYLAFGAATPGQGGTGHLNEQQPDYWIEKLEAHGFRVEKAFGERLPTDVSWWYRQNAMIAVRRPQPGRA